MSDEKKEGTADGTSGADCTVILTFTYPDGTVTTSEHPSKLVFASEDEKDED